MCCFSGPVERVYDTNIFARAGNDGYELLAYAMSAEAARDVAMILPLPVPAGSPEDAVRFLDLSGKPDFFTALRAGFVREDDEVRAMSRGPALQARAAPLQVTTVGAFEASFVPSPSDFDRLDPRFRLSTSALAALPQYADWGFAVFKLRGFVARRPIPFHPMAFAFPRREPADLFFPTTHVHDGLVHDTAEFDHVLYVQRTRVPRGWECSTGPAKRFISTDLTAGIVDPDLWVMRLPLTGMLRNADRVLAV